MTISKSSDRWLGRGGLIAALALLTTLVGCSSETLVPTAPEEVDNWTNDTRWTIDTVLAGSDEVVIVDGFEGAFGITVADDGTMYVPDIWTGQVVRFTSDLRPDGWLGMVDGGGLVSGWHYEGEPVRAAATGAFDMAHSVTFNSHGDLLIADYGAGRIAQYTADGSYLGCFFDNPAGADLAFDGCANAWFDPECNLWVADFDLHRVYKFDAQGNLIGWMGERTDGTVTGGFTVLGTSVYSTSLYGFNKPQMVRTDSQGNFYVAEIGNHRIQKFAPNGLLLGWIGAHRDGSLTNGWELDGLGEETSLPGGFRNPTSIFFLPGDTMIICDNGNSRIQKFAPDGTFIGWMGGRADGGVTDGWAVDGLSSGGDAPGQFLYPYDAVVHAGKMYVADGHNGRVQIFDLH